MQCSPSINTTLVLFISALFDGLSMANLSFIAFDGVSMPFLLHGSSCATRRRMFRDMIASGCPVCRLKCWLHARILPNAPSPPHHLLDPSPIPLLSEPASVFVSCHIRISCPSIRPSPRSSSRHSRDSQCKNPAQASSDPSSAAWSKPAPLPRHPPIP